MSRYAIGNESVPKIIILYYCYCYTLCLQCLWPSVPLRCWLGGRKGTRPVKKLEWWGPGMVICLERGADLHMAQLMSLPLTVSCFSKIQISFTLLVPAHLGSPGQRAVKGCTCVCACVLHPFNGFFSRTTLVSWYQKGIASLDLNEARDAGVWGMAVAPAGPYANSLHLITQFFLQNGCSS